MTNTAQTIDLAGEMIQIAESYLQHGSELIYSIKSRTFLSAGPVFDDENGHRGRIDCSTFIHLILQGISYEKSPYCTKDPGSFFHSDCPWAFRDLLEAFESGSVPVRRSHQLAKYYWDLGLCHSGSGYRRGDLLFFQVRPERIDFYLSFHIFKAIYHIGMVAEDGISMYESSGSQTVNVEENAERPGVRLSPITSRRPPLFYVRPSELAAYFSR